MTRTANAKPHAPLRTSNSDPRKRLIRAVLAAAHRLGIDDDERHALQRELTGEGSLSAMPLAQIGIVLDRLNRDWKGPMGHRSHLGKIRALWWTLYWLGEVDRPDDEALASFVKRQTGVERLNFLDHRKATSVIEALKSWCHRIGVQWPTPAEYDALVEAIRQPLDQAQHDRHFVMRAIGAKLEADRTIISTYPYVQTALGLANNHWCWSAHELDAAIRLLGKKWRARKERDEQP